MSKKVKDQKLDTSTRSKVVIRVGVGYGWMKPEKPDVINGREVLSDICWKTLQKAFTEKHRWLEKDNAEVQFSRLRASQGDIAWKSILNQIKKSDILVFDVAAAPVLRTSKTKKDCGDLSGKIASMKKSGNKFNPNVLIEIGAAIGMKKTIMLLCPKDFEDDIPSDLRAYMWTLYKWQGVGKCAHRVFVDQYGMQNGYIGMLRRVLKEKRGE